ncbi:unnamed protein product [Durusdinium trenchii]|uniref:DNA repair protein RAD2 n=1 Tax=Durusdinium trenchii TaxID=1381693 RepID=A0ABP0SDY7_9DINO
MGVQGLWDLASPAGQRVNFSALENKVVAVDASIWMYHFLKAMRDDKGDMVKGAHLIGFFRRICKLLYLKIRPVFVFDGPPPALKWKTLQLRAKQRDSEERQRRKAVERLLRNQLQQHLLQAASAAQPGAEAPAEAADATRAADEDLHATEEAAQDAAREDDDPPDAEEESVEEALPASSSRSRRRNGVPVAFRGFMAQRRGISQVQVPELPSEPLREILNVPNRRPHGRMRPPDEWKGYSIPGGGMVTVPLDGPVRLEEFEQLDPKTKYLLLQRAQEAWFGESRLKAVEAKDDMGAFVNVQLEMFLRSMAEQASRPAGDELADGEVYRAPSFLQAEREQPQASQAVEEFGQVESVIGNKGKGKRGRRSKRPRQLANEPTRWQPLSGVGIKRNSDPMVWFSEAQDEAESHSEESHSPKAKPQEVETAEDLFGNEFFEAEEAAKRRKVPEPEVFQVHAPSATTTDSLMDDSLAEAFSPHPSSPLSDGAVFADIGEEDLAPPSPSFDTAMDEVEAVEVFSPKRQPPSALAAAASTEDTFEPANFPSPAGEPTVPAQAVFVQDTFEPANFPSPEREPAVPAQAAFVEDTSEHANFPSPARELTVPAQSASVEDTSEPANFPSPEREPTVPARAAFVEDTSERANFPSPARREPTVSAQAKTVAAAAAAAAAPAPRPSRSDTEDPSKSVWCNTHFQYRWRCHQDGVAHVCDAQGLQGQGTSAPSAQGSGGRGKGRGHGRNRDPRGEESALGDEELEELEFQRLAAELEDEHRDLRAEARRAKRGADVVTPEMQADVEALLEALGIPFVHAPAEAEAQCAFLAEAHLVDAVASDDSDVLVFGAREVYRRMFSEDQQVECYSSARLEARLGLLQDQLIVLAMLLGCDYTLGVHGVGIVNGLEIVRAYSPGRGAANIEEWLKRLETFRSWAQNVANWGKESAGVQDDDSRAMAEFKRKHTNFRTQWSFPTDFPSAAVMTAFQQPEVDRSLEPFSWASVDVQRVVAKLQAADLSEEKVLERLEPVLRRYQDTLRQPRITEYLLPSAGDVAVVRSSRMQEALRGLRGESPEQEESGVSSKGPKGRRKAKSIHLGMPYLVPPARGRALLFRSYTTAGAHDPTALHGSCAAGPEGKKVAQKWFRARQP